MVHRDAPLRCVIEDNQLVIRIGVATLVYAVNVGLNDEYPEGQEPQVTDEDVFAAAILEQLEREDDEGTTCVHILLDEAAKAAIEDGCEGVWLPGDDV